MLEIKNRTPFQVAITPGMDRDDFDTATVLVKGTFSIGRRAEALPIADEQVGIHRAPVWWGDPEKASLRYESDLGPAKPGTDVVLAGHAYAPKGRADRVDVAVAAGPLRKTVRVFGERVWVWTLGAATASPPVPFDRIPLLWERAFGGWDTSDADPRRHEYEPRNPVGRGFSTGRNKAQIDGLPLPNLEDPEHPIKRPKDRPAPAGFGFVSPNWQPRAGFAGTYDERWKAERAPFLPADFDERHLSSAAPGLTAPVHLAGGEPVAILNAHTEPVRFLLPRRPFECSVALDGDERQVDPAIDTVLVEPDEGRVVVCWRATFRCPRAFLYIDAVRVAPRKQG